MGSDLIALVVALTLGTAVVILGLRRNLSETTRNGLPRFGGPGRATATLGLYEGEERQRRPLSQWQRRWLAPLYLLLALIQAASAVLSSHDWLIHAATAALWLLGAVVFLLRKPPHPAGEPAPDAI
jgi:hypothetical protein